MENLNSKPFDVCVITTIHSLFDARIYERSLESLVDYGFSASLISPSQKPENLWIKHQWIYFPYSKRCLERIAHGNRTFRAAYKQQTRIYYFHDIDFILWAVLLKSFKHVSVVYDCNENNPREIAFHKEWIPFLFRSGKKNRG